ncbi:hypothetical protein P3W45_000551 [Vairimorpha bombi]
MLARKSVTKDYTEYNFGRESLKSYKDDTYKKIRCQYGINEFDVGSFYYYNPSIRGNSSSLIFFNSDFRFAIKTINRNEFDTLLRITDAYFSYVVDHPETLIVKIFGCYEIKNNNQSVSFIIMKNIFNTLSVCDIYDLKGYGVLRKTNQLIKKDKEWISENNKIMTKDDNLVNQIKKDTLFLKDLNIMDYSLVISVNTSICNKFFTSVNLKEVHNSNDVNIIYDGDYSLGIIDILTSYNNIKKCEHWFNYFCLCTNKKSCINSSEYKKRFLELVENHVILTGSEFNIEMTNKYRRSDK